MSDKNDYEGKVRATYDAAFLDSFLQRTNKAFNEALAKKNLNAENWGKIVAFYKNRGYARDTSNSSHLQTNSLIIGFNEMSEGIILNISYLPLYIGIYFYHKTLDALVPVTDGDGKFCYHLSFFPFNLKQQDRSMELLMLVKHYFPDFEIFNNLFSAEKIKNVIIDGLIKEEATLFHTIFEDKMYTVF